MREYPIWRCSCGHIISRDLIQPENPGACRHPRGTCQSSYKESEIADEEEPAWAPGELEFQDQSLWNSLQRERLANSSENFTSSHKATGRVRTHCHRGHELTPDNVYVTNAGHKQCKACVSFRGKLQRERTRMRRKAREAGGAA